MPADDEQTRNLNSVPRHVTPVTVTGSGPPRMLRLGGQPRSVSRRRRDCIDSENLPRQVSSHLTVTTEIGPGPARPDSGLKGHLAGLP